MTSRSLKAALAVSVALNLFGAAALITTLVSQQRVERSVAAQHQPPREGSAMAVVGQLDAEVRDRVRSTLRASALAARPDFDEARRKRRQAVALASAETYDSPRVMTLLRESSAAEMRGRTRLEADAVALLATLDADDRASLSKILTRRGRAGARGDGQVKVEPIRPQS